MKDILDFCSNLVSILALFGLTFEVSPIKISPFGWLGKKINKETNAKIDNVQKQLNDVKKEVDTMKYKNDMKDLADVRNRLISYGILIQKGEKLEPNVISSIQHDLDTYDYYKETYKYMEINGRKIKINGEIETTRRLVNEMILKGVDNK